MDVKFTEVQAFGGEQIETVAALADVIWHEHYTPIIGEAQVEYMLKKFQSAEALTAQLSSGGYRYFIITAESKPCGYLGIVNEGELLFLSKLYLLKEQRGRGLSRIALEFAKSKAKESGCGGIYLTVNKFNSDSISAYEHMGFKTVRMQTADIGCSYVMDDYIMQLDLKNRAVSRINL